MVAKDDAQPKRKKKRRIVPEPLLTSSHHPHHTPQPTGKSEATGRGAATATAAGMATPASTNGGSKAVVGAGWDGEAAAALEAGVGAGYQSLPQLSPPHVADGDGCVPACRCRGVQRDTV